MGRHTIYYEDIPVADYTTAGDLRLRDPNEIFIDNTDRFASPEDAEAFVRVIFAHLNYFLRGNIPEGIRRQSLIKQCGGINASDIAPYLDEFTGCISIDRRDMRRFSPVPTDIKSGSDVVSLIPQEEYNVAASKRSYGARPSSFAGYFDKFTAILDKDLSGAALRESVWKEEIGNVIVKTHGEYYPYICVNEAFCTGLAEKCEIEVPRRWIVSADDGWGLKKHLVTERFGIYCGDGGRAARDLIFDTGMLLGDKIKDNYSISGEDYFDFMRALLSDGDMDKFMRAYLYGFVIGNCDMHVKNFSVRYAGDSFELTPQYDIVSFKPYGLHEDLALSLNGKKRIASKDFYAFITERGLQPKDAADICGMLTDNFDAAAAEYINMNDPGEKMLYDRILRYSEKRRSEIIALAKRDIAIEEKPPGEQNQGGR